MEKWELKQLKNKTERKDQKAKAGRKENVIYPSVIYDPVWFKHWKETDEGWGENKM